jgi:iron complex transport system substrate-binding protein
VPRAAVQVLLLANVLLLAPPHTDAAQVPPPRRVASLNLTADEVLVDILPLETIVAVTAAADEAGMSNIVGRVPQSVARFLKADLERLLALHPDLVVVSDYTDADFLRALQRSGLPFHRMTGLDSIPGFRRAILDLGRAVGEEGAARRLVKSFDARLAELERRLAGVEQPRVLYWSSPFTAGAGTAIGALITCGGARNAAREMGISGLAPLGAERAFLSDPDIVLIGAVPGEADALRAHPLLSQLRAVRDGRIVEARTKVLVAMSHHSAESCWALAAAFHPDRIGERPR